jgi:uncharacterized protein (TIRG00374 family)
MRNLTAEEKKEILQSFRQANYWWIFLSMGLGILSHIGRTLRWKMLMEPMGYNPKFRNVFFSVFIGYFANLALPRLGEISRCGVLTKYEKIPFQKSFGTVVTERAIDLLTFIILFFVNLALQFNKVHFYIEEKIYQPLSEKFSTSLVDNYFLIGLLAILLFGIFLLFFFRRKVAHAKVYLKIKEFIFGFIEGLKSLTKIKRPWLFVFYSIFIWLLYFVMTYVVFSCLPETKSLSLIAGFAVFIFASIGIIVVQGGIGIYPAIVAETLFIYNIAEPKGYAMGWLLWTGQTVMIIAAGLISLTLLPMLNRTNNGKT